MSDDDKLLEGLGDLDWDSALDEWEKNTFVPEVARDAESNKIAPPPPELKPAPDAPSPRPAAGVPLSASGEGTVIAPVPAELRDDPPLRASAVPPPVARVSAPPPPQRGGLGQLFAKGKEERTPGQSVRPMPVVPKPTSPSEKTRVAPKATTLPGIDEAALARSAGPISSVTRQLASPFAEAEEQGDPTVIGRREGPGEDERPSTELPQRGSISDAETQTRHPSDRSPTFDPEGPTGTHVHTAVTAAEGAASVGPSTDRHRPPAPDGPSAFEGERPISRWLDEKSAAQIRQRVIWLEEEARATENPVDQARSLLVVSELCAMVGDRDEALAFAVEARDLAPSVALAWRQVRQLMGEDNLAENLDAEAATASTPAARAHATLMAADVMRIQGDGDGAAARWLAASRLDPADVRAHAARAALALAANDHTSAGADLAENSELEPLYKAVTTALRLRGIERPGADVTPMPINDGLRGARIALEAGETVAAAQALTEVAGDPGLTKGATWLSAALGATHIAGRRAAARGLKTLANDGGPLARRQLAARGIELADPELVIAALSEDAAFQRDEHAALLALAGQPVGPAMAGVADRAALSDALAAASSGEPSERARLTSGSPEARAMTTLGRLLAAGLRGEPVDEFLGKLGSPPPPSAAGVAIDAAVRAKRIHEIASALGEWPMSGDDADQRHVAAALVAERAGDRDAARHAWAEALASTGTNDGILRAAAGLDPDVDLATELLRIADAMPDGPAAAILRLESLGRAIPEDDEQATILARVHESAPELGIGAFLAERIARRRGDLDEVLRWIQERRATATDPLETALDAVREALLVADRDPDLAGTRLEEAHLARPDDVALRELYERLAVEPPKDRAIWREARAAKATGARRATLLTEAAIEHERAADDLAAIRAAKAAIEAGDEGLARVVLARAELSAGQTESQTETLLARAKEAEDDRVRVEAYEQLAELDEIGKKDDAAALLWHRTILEEAPRHVASLRFVEHALIGQGRGDELDRVAEQIALTLDGASAGDGEVSGHAQVAARLLARSGGWEKTRDMARLAATQRDPSLWSLRALNAHARVAKDDDALLKTIEALLERTSRPAERAALLLRASEAAARLERPADARGFLEQAASEDPADVVTWGFLAEVREHTGELRAAAEACESLARTSAVPEHQLLAWYDAARLWLENLHDQERGMSALEQAAEVDVTYEDVFTRLSALYGERRLDAELARLLEKRLERAEDSDERVTLEVERARALGEMGELARAKKALESALSERPDHTTALAAMAELCAKEGDWAGAEQAYVRLARLLATPEEQRAIFDKLGDIYLDTAPNLTRAEVAFREVLKRAPKDVLALGKLVSVYRRQGDVPRAVETQQELVQEASEPGVRLDRLIELSSIYETARDLRKAEQVLESARKEFPTSVVALRALAEFYRRQHQMPAMQILLDRAAGDARRSFAAGRFVTALFEVLHAAYELRGKKDAARVVAATLAAIEGGPPGAGPGGARPVEVVGGEARAADPRLDDVLAPDIINPALRQLLYSAGDALDATAPVDLRALRATPLVPGTPMGATVGAVATVVGLGALQILVSPAVGRVAIPLSSNPPTLLVGEKLMTVDHERARMFVVVRALKMILCHASAFVRGQPDEVAVLASALFTAFNPSFVPQGVDGKKVAEVARRLHPALPRNLDPTVGVIALEAAGTVATRANELAAGAHAWANRVALLAVGDPSAALDAIAWGRDEDAAPTGSEERAAWVARNAEARELMTFSVTDHYAEARARLGLDK